ncbi:MAG TPA: ATP-binding protein, partial [Bdellovibrionales bacterium]|nr:ATP-binding protein [Bdellovibrionales bacterium]
VAHEINNPLQIIIGQASMMRSKMSRTTIPPEEIAKTLEKIETTADRIALIVKGLRTVAREGNQDPYRRTNLMSIVNDALSLCTERIRGKDITLETNLSEIEGLQIDCRSVQISQILLNLLTNAYHAVEGSAERWIRLEARVIDSQVEFAVVDSGTGILPEHRSKIFQPFFTTKDVGRGTGLGLSISLSIARDHEGDLYLDPTSSNTRFVLKLPLEH